METLLQKPEIDHSTNLDAIKNNYFEASCSGATLVFNLNNVFDRSGLWGFTKRLGVGSGHLKKPTN